MTKGTKVSTVIQKAPFVALQRLRPQDVAGLKLKSPQYRTTRTTRSSKDANDSRVKGRWLKEQDETAYKVTTPFEDGVQGATKDVESCLPAGEEGSKEHHCFRCSMNFPNSDTLVLHLKSHGPVRRSCTLYEKEVCGTSIDDGGPQNRSTMASTSKQGESSSPRTKKKTELEEITSSHSGGSRFPCNMCNKVFMQSNHLKLHMRSHSDGKADKEQGTETDNNSPPLDTNAFIKMMKNVIQETAIKCFSNALESDNVPSSSDDALDLVRTRARKAMEQFCSNSEGLVDLKEQRDRLEHILLNLDLDPDPLDIKQEDNYDDCNGGGSDKNVVSVNSHNESSNCPDSLANHQATFESENSAQVPECSSASDKHTENVRAASVTDNVICPVQNVVESKKITAVTRKAQETKNFTENVLCNNVCTPHKSSVPDTQKDVTTKVSPSKKHSPVGSTPPREPGQSDTDNVKTSGGANTALTTYQQLMVRKSKKLFSCHICRKVFTLQSHLKLHRRNVHGTKQSKQNIDIRFSEDADPKEEKYIAENKLHFYQCNVKSCRKVFRRERNFKLHLNTHKRKGLFNCSVCDKVFPAECILKQHEKCHSESPLYSCTKCEKSYDLNEDLLLHMSREHFPSKPSENTSKIIKEPLLISPHFYKCVECNIQFTDNNTYELHLKSDHTHVPNSGIHTTSISISGSPTGVPLHVCVKCNLQFPNGTALEHHLHTCPSSVLEKEKALVCSNCSMKFPDDISLQHHMKLSHSKMLLKCPRCDLKFPNGNALQAHMKDHGTISTPKCSKCQSTFSSDALLERHMKLRHSMIQSSNQHKCSKCGIKFNNQALLARHTTLTHSPKLEEAKNMLTCSTCGMKFRDGSSFHSHMKHHTSVIQKPTKLCDATLPQDVVVIDLSDLDTQINSIQRDKLQNMSVSMDNTGTTVQCSQCGMHFSDRNELQSHMKLNHSSKMGSQYSEVNHTLHVSAKNLQPSPKGQKKVMLVTKDSKSNAVPILEKSPTCSQISERNFECLECNIQFTDSESLKTHMKLNHTPSLKSPKGKVTKKSGTESKQTNVQHAVSTEYNFFSSSTGNPHSKRGGTVFECSKCLLIFKSNESLQNHINMQHSPMPKCTNIFKCLRCHKQFHTSTQFRSHLRTHRKRVCPECGKNFTTKIALNKHMSLHSNQLLYKCDRCASQFSSSFLFKRHIRWHDAKILIGNTQKHTKTGNPDSLQNARDSSPIIDYVEPFGIGDSETTLHDGLDDENLNTADDDIIVLSDDENTVNKEIHNTDEVELNDTDDEIMMILDDINTNQLNELSNEQLRNSTPELSIQVQTEVVLSQESTPAFLTDGGDKTSSNLHTSDDIGSVKRVPLARGTAVSSNDSLEWHECADLSSDAVSDEIVDKSTVPSRKLSSSVGRSKSFDISSAACSINEGLSDSQDSVQLENHEIVKKSSKVSLVSSKRKCILKDTNHHVRSLQKKRNTLRVSFADDVSNRESVTCMRSEDMERTMPILSPEKMTVDSNKSIAFQKNAKYSSQFKNCYVSLTRLEDCKLGSIANQVTRSNKNASEEFHKSRKSPKNTIHSGREIDDKGQSQKFNESLRNGTQKLSLSVEAKDTSLSKDDNKLGPRTLLHYFHYENAVNNHCEKENSQVISKSPPMATSTPLTNKINTFRTTAHTSIHSAKGENRCHKEDHPADDMGHCNKLGLSNNVTPNHSERKNRKSASSEKEELEPPKRSTYMLKNKPSRIKVGKFKCKYCGKIFQFLPHFRVHKKTHAGQLIHKCPICTDRFPLRFLLGLHIADHFEKGIPQMISENKRSSNKSASSISNNLSPSFDIPNKNINPLTQDDSAPKPMEPSHSSIVSTTTLVEPTNQTNSLLQNKLPPSSSNTDHFSPHPNVNNSKESNVNYCPDEEFRQCEDSFGYSASIEKKEDLKFACGKCNKRFTNLLRLKIHQSIHTGVGLYKCSYCDLMFYFKASLLSHVKTHSGEKKYACKYCGSMFEEYSLMLNHRTNHELGGRPFKCPECPKTFALDSSLGSHMQLHASRAWYKCTLCNWSFKVKSKLQNHILIHSDKKPFMCKLCKTSFRRMLTCHLHIKRIHIAKNEITLKSTQSVMDFVHTDQRTYKALKDFVQDITKKISLVRDGKLQTKSDTVALADITSFTERKNEEIPITTDKELPEPILLDPRRLQDSFGKEICKPIGREMCKPKTNCTLSDRYSTDMNKKERFEKLCVEVRNVLTRMKSYSQIPVVSPSRNLSYLKTPTRQIQYPRLAKSLNLSENKSPNNLADTSENKSPNNLADTSKDKQGKSGNLNRLGGQTPSPKGSIVQKSPEKCVNLDEQHNITVPIQKEMKTREKIHTGGDGNLCSFCGRRFTSKSSLRYHLAHHADVKHYPCTLCGRAFILKQQMYSHLRKHTNEVKHTCKICSKSFFFKGHLESHILTHTELQMTVQV